MINLRQLLDNDKDAKILKGNKVYDEAIVEIFDELY